eukprot:GFUD01068952.1.p1 GENE.GFUD01068952.1~~GFUD01068952.1.p1  ORF type:complete len:642 (+),score=124.09 GFUD01068952.1:63-1988(+)
MERPTASSPGEEEGLPLVNRGTKQQEPRPQILRTFSRESTRSDMSSPTKAFRQKSSEEETLDLEPGNNGQLEHEQWGKPIQFLLSCIAMSVGLGNVWRFPFVVYKNGGGAFLIPYLLVLLLFGRPLYLLELGLGQFASSGAVPVWDMAPGFRGIGYGQAFASFIVITYYSVIIGLSIIYLVASFNPVLPWTVCNPLLNETLKICLPSGANASNFNTENLTIVPSVEQYFLQGIGNMKSDITDGLGVPDATMMAALGVVWFLLYVCMRSGLRGQGKVSYFTAIVPYIILIIMLVKGLTLEGSWNGIFFTPKFKRLLDVEVWYDAITQSFYSLTIGFGCLGTYAKYNNFRHPTSRDALIISFADCFSSILAGTVIFAVLGHLAHQQGRPDEIGNIVGDGGLLFVFMVYPEVLASFPVSNLFSILFFLMLATLGFGSGIGLLCTITTTVYEVFPGVKNKTLLKAICILGAAIGLFYVTPGGFKVLTMADDAFNRIILGLACLEVIAICWVYGTDTVMRDLNFMLNTKLSIYWRFCWGIFCPVLLPLVFAYMMIFKGWDKDIQDIPVAKLFALLLTMAGLLFVPGNFLLSLLKEQEGKRWWHKLCSCARNPHLKNSLLVLFKPNDNWGPKQTELKEQWKVGTQYT